MSYRYLYMLVISLLLGSSSALATEAKGLIVASKGTVLVMGETSSGARDIQELAQGENVYVDDTVITGDKSFAVIQFLDGAKIIIKPNSKLHILAYTYNGSAKDKATIGLVSGGLRVITGAMAKSNPENYQIQTSVALMGVRGTEFSIQLQNE